MREQSVCVSYTRPPRGLKRLSRCRCLSASSHLQRVAIPPDPLIPASFFSISSHLLLFSSHFPFTTSSLTALPSSVFSVHLSSTCSGCCCLPAATESSQTHGSCFVTQQVVPLAQEGGGIAACREGGGRPVL